ncbi:hypothetical protein J5T34_18535 [Cupriavidus gilardii]|uniref:hypothetical protein n=1 Tax=Cupriavidus gilardii TaxID=82541 RepID=UPI001ABEB6F0|nr:hypothetical protein [Cupriavidus gilardii]MBO4122729.1 hypothetical protein [Cupriavidus gilardii]
MVQQGFFCARVMRGHRENIPTIAEAGVPGYEVVYRYGAFITGARHADGQAASRSSLAG